MLSDVAPVPFLMKILSGRCHNHAHCVSEFAESYIDDC